MAAALPGLTQAQTQVKQQTGSASDRSLRSVFGKLRLAADVFIEILSKSYMVDS